MDLLKKCLIEFNNQWTNKITEKEVDDNELLSFTLLDMQNFAKKYAEAINYTLSCERDSELLPKRLSNRAYNNAKKMRYEDFVKWWDEQV